MIADLRRARRASLPFPRVILVTLSSVEETEAFLSTRWPQARAIADPHQVLRTAFGIRRGGAKEFLAPGVWLAGMRAVFKGNGVGKPAGDVLSMPGMALVADGHMLWEQVFQHAGSKPDFDAVREFHARFKAQANPSSTTRRTPCAGTAPSP